MYPDEDTPAIIGFFETYAAPVALMLAVSFPAVANLEDNFSENPQGNAIECPAEVSDMPQAPTLVSDAYKPGC